MIFVVVVIVVIVFVVVVVVVVVVVICRSYIDQTVATESTNLTGDIEMPEAENCDINEGKVCDVDTTDDNASLSEGIKRSNKH